MQYKKVMIIAICSFLSFQLHSSDLWECFSDPEAWIYSKQLQIVQLPEYHDLEDLVIEESVIKHLLNNGSTYVRVTKEAFGTTQHITTEKWTKKDVIWTQVIIAAAVAAAAVVGAVGLQYYWDQIKREQAAEAERKLEEAERGIVVCLECTDDHPTSLNHIFHKTCIKKWFKKQMRDPKILYTSFPNCKLSCADKSEHVLNNVINRERIIASITDEDEQDENGIYYKSCVICQESLLSNATLNLGAEG